MSKKMLINASHIGERRLAIVDGPELLELFIERASGGPHVGDIYLAKIVNIEPSIQAAFVDFGKPKNGFLHISDIMPSCFAQKGGKTSGKDRPPIQSVMQKGQTLLVQITKTGIGTKGPAMTTYISLPGRYMVLMPGMHRHGVSRKIEDEPTRQRLRKILEEISEQKDFGVIIRTAGSDRTKQELKHDLSYLQKLWKNIQKHRDSAEGPGIVYQESDLAIRGIRDFYTTDIDEIVVDSPEVEARINEFAKMMPKRQQPKLRLYSGVSGLFEEHDIEQEIAKMFSRKVDLPKGGHIVIDQAEALVAIDVNSGSFRASKDPEENIYRLNLIAAKEVARQLRLRDLGGVIVIDFVDMKSDKHVREVERTFAREFKKDKARTKILKMSKFCILQMTRQRMRPSIGRSIYRDCPICNGIGYVKNMETMALDFFRQLAGKMVPDYSGTITAKLHPEVSHYILNRRRHQLYQVEKDGNYQVVIEVDNSLSREKIEFRIDKHLMPGAAKPKEEKQGKKKRKHRGGKKRTAEPQKKETPQKSEKEKPAEKPAVVQQYPKEKPVEKPVAEKKHRRRRPRRKPVKPETPVAKAEKEKVPEEPAVVQQYPKEKAVEQPVTEKKHRRRRPRRKPARSETPVAKVEKEKVSEETAVVQQYPKEKAAEQPVTEKKHRRRRPRRKPARSETPAEKVVQEKVPAKPAVVQQYPKEKPATKPAVVQQYPKQKPVEKTAAVQQAPVEKPVARKTSRRKATPGRSVKAQPVKARPVKVKDAGRSASAAASKRRTRKKTTIKKPVEKTAPAQSVGAAGKDPVSVSTKLKATRKKTTGTRTAASRRPKSTVKKRTTRKKTSARPKPTEGTENKK